jgi:hypothetical protein
MTLRAHYVSTAIVADAVTGLATVIRSPTVTVCEPGTSTPISPTLLWNAPTGGANLPNPFDGAADGTVEFWLDVSARATGRVRVVATGVISGSLLGTLTADYEDTALDLGAKTLET